MSQYAALSHEDKAKLYNHTFSNYQQLHSSSSLTDAIEAYKHKLAKYFKKVRPAEDRLEIVALQKWYLETLSKLEEPKEENQEDYFKAKALVFSYVFHSVADYLKLFRREISDLLTTSLDDFFKYLNEVTGSR